MKALEIQTLFAEHFIECQVQIKRQPTKPFDQAMVKFQSAAYLQVATEKLRYLKTASGHCLRFLPYEQALFKGQSAPALDKSCSNSLNLSMCQDEDPEFTGNLPDNSYAQTNLCVTGLDCSLTSADLHQIFEPFGEIKSCKVATDSATGQSKCYGFVWFKSEASCKSALACKDLPYPTQLY